MLLERIAVDVHNHLVVVEYGLTEISHYSKHSYSPCVGVTTTNNKIILPVCESGKEMLETTQKHCRGGGQWHKLKVAPPKF